MGKDNNTAGSYSSGDALFEAVMRGAKPLGRRPEKQNKKRNEKLSAAADESSDVVWAPTAPKHPRSELSPGSSGGNLDKRSANRLRRGQMRIEGRLDLHGYTQAEAHRAVHAFIVDSQRLGRRCVLIITGKGSPRENVDIGFMPNRNIGVLRRNLPRWLAQPPVHQMVLHMEPARSQHGGDGAFYVLLRRKSK